MMGDLILIDRSALLEAIDEREQSVRKVIPDLQEDEIRPTLKSLREFINNRPIVDAEPVRHGTWEMCRKTLKTGFATMTGTYPTCSLCGYVEYGVDKSTPYCPGCGAKMDGGNECSVTHRAD